MPAAPARASVVPLPPVLTAPVSAIDTTANPVSTPIAPGVLGACRDMTGHPYRPWRAPGPH